VKSQNDQNIEAEQQQVKSVDTAKNLQAGDANTSATKGQVKSKFARYLWIS
jgi:hypothetical protein